MMNLILFVGRNTPKILVGLIIVITLNAGVNLLKGAADLTDSRTARQEQIDSYLK